MLRLYFGRRLRNFIDGARSFIDGARRRMMWSKFEILRCDWLKEHASHGFPHAAARLPAFCFLSRDLLLRGLVSSLDFLVSFEKICTSLFLLHFN